MTLPSWDISEAETRLVNYHRSLSKTRKTIRRNKWRPDPKFGALEEQIFEGILGCWGFWECLSRPQPKNPKTLRRKNPIRNRRTASLATKTRNRTRHSTARHRPTNPQTHKPPLTPSSEASIHYLRETSLRNLISKRYRENRCYLQYIKSGHPNICALEAFLDFTSEISDPSEQGLVILASYYEFCDGGTLQDIISRYEAGYQKCVKIIEENHVAVLFNRTVLDESKRKEIQDVPSRRHPPELFIWHIYAQLMGAIAFLHNEHPDYMDMEEHRTRAMIMTADLAPANTFLKWKTGNLTERRRMYPDVKVGDFGGANFLPKGGRLVMGGEKLDFVWGDPPEFDAYDGKTDLWCVGAMMYMLGTQTKTCEYKEEGVKADGTKKRETKKEQEEREARQKINPERVGELEGMYSSTLNKAVRAALRIERDKRPSSGVLCKHIETSYRMRKPLMFRTLPEWSLSGKRILKHKFPKGRIANLVAGAFEKENEKYEAEEKKEMEVQDREAALMWVEKDRKMRFGVKLEEWEEGDDEDHTNFLKEMIRDTPEFYKELLEEAKISVSSP